MVIPPPREGERKGGGEGAKGKRKSENETRASADAGRGSEMTKDKSERVWVRVPSFGPDSNRKSHAEGVTIATRACSPMSPFSKSTAGSSAY